MKKASIIHLTIIGMLISTTALSAEAHGRRHRHMRRMHQMRQNQTSVRPQEPMAAQETPAQATPTLPPQVAQETPAQSSAPVQATPAQTEQTPASQPSSMPVQGIAVGEPNPSGISLSQSNTNSTMINQSSPGSTEDHKDTMIITTASLDSGDSQALGSAAKEGDSSSTSPILAKLPPELLPPGDDFIPKKSETLDTGFASVMGKDISSAISSIIDRMSGAMVEMPKKEISPADASGTSIVMSDDGPQIVMVTQVVDEEKKGEDHSQQLISALGDGLSLPSSEESDKAKEMAKKAAQSLQSQMDDIVLKSDADLTEADGQKHDCKKMLSGMRDRLMSIVPEMSDLAAPFIGGGL